ncbi:hypothetical protein ABIC83_002409 [Roseateles asaccharophilus]|uniref:hypothetical protein n=1 Tax=Roseateles asaccharophilus TaxID=582607 RepID=UPI0038333531
MNQTATHQVEPRVGLTRHQKDLLVEVATARQGLHHESMTVPQRRAATFLEAAGLIARVGDRWSITEAGQRRCTSIY